MILEFKFRNFRSAKDWQVLSFEASSDKVAEEYYCTTINDTKDLNLAFSTEPMLREKPMYCWL